jgi:UDP-perosamine 4-acetyltransferase
MMIAIIGAGGHSKCVFECFHQKGQEVYGFFDDDHTKDGLEIINGLKVIGSPDKVTEYKQIHDLFIAIGDNRQRLEYYKRFKGEGFSFPNAIHLKAHISKFAVIGKGNFLMGSAIVNPGSTIGDLCIINTNATVGHDCILEDGVQIGPGVNIAGGCTLQEGVFVGIGAKIAPGVKIGSWAVVGAGSVVLEDLPDYKFYYGLPAKIIRDDIMS